jgi:hypothetical protein
MGRRKASLQEKPEEVMCIDSIVVIPDNLTVCDVDIAKGDRYWRCYLIWSSETPTHSYALRVDQTQTDFETYVRPYINGISGHPSKGDIAVLQDVIMSFIQRNKTSTIA